MTLKAILASATALAFFAAAQAAAQGTLTVTSWGGAYTAAQTEAFHRPFTEATGVRINSVDYNGGIAEVKAQVEAGNVSWDVVDMELSDAMRACDEGLLETIDPAILSPAPDGTPLEDDFLPGTVTPCTVGITVVSTVIAYDRGRFPDTKPQTAEDFFDLEQFPGRRSLRRGPQRTLELALIADGVPADEVYEVLATAEGVDRALAKLDTIRDQVVWWETGGQPAQLLADGEVVMATSFNGRIFNAQVRENKPFEIIWDGQVWELSGLVVPRGAPNRDNAMQFIAMATEPERLAALSNHIAYGPARKSAMPLIGQNPETGVDMAPHMPTRPDHLKRAVPLGVEFWADHAAALEERFATWLARM